MLRSDTLARVRHALGRTAGDSIAYRVTLEREADADRETYEQHAASLTDGLEASIRDAGSDSFESLAVSRAAGPYSRTMAAIDDKKQRLVELDARLEALGDTSRLWWSSTSKGDLISDREKAARSLDELLHNDRQRTANTVAYRVSFAPKSSETIAAIASEFDRLSTLGGVESVELASDAPDDDPRNSIDFRGQKDREQ